MLYCTCSNAHVLLYMFCCTCSAVHVLLYMLYCTCSTAHVLLYMFYCTCSTVHVLLYMFYCICFPHLDCPLILLIPKDELASVTILNRLIHSHQPLIKCVINSRTRFQARYKTTNIKFLSTGVLKRSYSVGQYRPSLKYRKFVTKTFPLQQKQNNTFTQFLKAQT